MVDRIDRDRVPHPGVVLLPGHHVHTAGLVSGTPRAGGELGAAAGRGALGVHDLQDLRLADGAGRVVADALGPAAPAERVRPRSATLSPRWPSDASGSRRDR